MDEALGVRQVEPRKREKYRLVLNLEAMIEALKQASGRFQNPGSDSMSWDGQVHGTFSRGEMEI